MWCKRPVWYLPEEILNKYRGLERAKFTEMFLGQLVDAYLLKGKYDRHKRKMFILEESVLVLINHINYNIYCELIQTSEDIIRYSVPSYCDGCNFSFNVSYEDSLWVSPSSILAEYPNFRDFKIFNERLICQLVHKKILRGRYDTTDRETLVLAPSFRELHKYIQYLHDLDKF